MNEKAKYYQSLLVIPEIQAFLYMLRNSEGTEAPKGHGYHTLVGGKRFASLSAHPNIMVQLSKKLWSNAAGAYQYMKSTWNGVKRALALSDFSKISQDIGCLYLIDKRGGLKPLLKGDVITAIFKCRKEWASLPMANYGQNEHSIKQVLAWYNAKLKQLKQK